MKQTKQKSSKYNKEKRIIVRVIQSVKNSLKIQKQHLKKLVPSL